MFKKLIVFVLISILIIINLTGCTEEKDEKNNTHLTLYVDDDGGADYIKIQDAINNIDVGGTIYVKNGTYKEAIKINKKVNLIGDVNNKVKISYNFYSGPSNIDGIVTFNADNCTFSGFDISFSYFLTGVKGIYISSSNNTINFCNITNIYQGIFFNNNVKNNNISNCIISSTKNGIYINNSSFNIIFNNTVIQSGLHGIYLLGSDSNIFSKNLVVNNHFGIYGQSSKNNIFFNNTIKNNSVGLQICCGSSENIVYNNSFIKNSKQIVYATQNENLFYKDGFGNYWDDYFEKYSNATQIDGIWSIPYKIYDTDYEDKYPLVKLVTI